MINIDISLILLIGGVLLGLGLLRFLFALIIARAITDVLVDNTESTNIDVDKVEMYQKELDKMILYQTVLVIDTKFGQRLNNTNGANAELTNEELVDAVDEIKNAVTSEMSPKMDRILSDEFGPNWMMTYINTQVSSMVINYANLDIKQLTSSIFET